MALTQFSLRSLLAAVAAVGIGAALWVAEPSWQAGATETLVSAWVLAAVMILAANSTGKAKAWWTGVAAELILVTFIFFQSWLAVTRPTPLSTLGREGFDSHFSAIIFFASHMSERFRSLLIAWAFAPVIGLLCVLTHWLLVRPPQGPQD